MKIEHIAIAYNSEEESDKFFIGLLGCKKTRSFSVSPDLTEQFFGIKKEQLIIRYENENSSFEVFITNDDSKSQDTFTHSCLLVQDRDRLVKKAKSMNFKTIQVPRKDSDSYYLFIKDYHGNLYEVKDLQ